MRPSGSWARLVATIASVALGVAGIAAFQLAGAVVAAADPGPVVSRDASGVTADSLPTAQVNGVAWTQQVSGNTVYVGGQFTSARPAGSPAGSNESARANLMSYTLSTGVMTSWAPTTNGAVTASALSPDGKRLYIVGNFTTVNGATHNRIAAFDATTGALITSFVAGVDGPLKAVTATNSTIYVGGGFSRANNSVNRTRLASFDASGNVLPWNPGADVTVFSMTTTPDASLVIIGGAFDQLAGQAARGLGAVDATTGARQPWAATSTVYDYGEDTQGPGTGAAIYSLTHDATNVYGSGYQFYGNGNLEGVFSAQADSGTINWIEDCHGDTYSVYPAANFVYSSSHAHYCGNIGGFPQSNPESTNQRFALAFSQQATGTIGHDPLGYYDFYGNPSPSLENWFPDFARGSYTGAKQSTWSVSGNSQYVVYGGEFPSVNGVAQQGLTRFAVPSVAPKKQGPVLSANRGWTPTVRALSSDTVRVSIGANWDRDDQNLTYQLIRNGKTVGSTTLTSQFWNLPSTAFTDSGLAANTTYQYYIRATDPDGNPQYSSTVSVTTPASGSISPYAKDVLGDGASDYWRLDEAAGSTGTSVDWAGTKDLTVSGGVTRGTPGAINGDADTAYTFDGSNGLAATSTTQQGPNTFSQELWFRTTTTSGGKLLGFGDRNTGTSGNYDRHVFMNPDGTLSFGVYNNGSYLASTSKPLNDGQWHYVVTSLSSAGMVLYVDGKKAATNTGTTIGQPYQGYWRIGGDSPWNGNAYFAGDIDDVAIYPTALTLAQVRQHYSDSGRSVATTPAPTDAYGKAVVADQPDYYYRMDDTSGPSASDASGNGNTGLYSGTETFGATSPVAGPVHTAVTFAGAGTLASPGPINDPTVYSEELWFNTTTTSGGKLIGFGSDQTGNSSHYDRHVYMENSGQLTFGTYTGQENTITSQQAYNDGNWHQMVATQGADGMHLYVDGALVGSSQQTGQENYSGYWRIGGDSSWAASDYFSGTIDEAAVYSSVLSPAQISAHYNAASAVNHAPTASFTATTTNLSVSLDASNSSDSDGTVASYAWDFGDGTSSTGRTTSHTYAAAGSYTVTLTVTDNGGATGSTAKSVRVTAAPPNQPPTAAFTSSVDHLAVSFDAGGSSDPDGTIASYAWDFGDGKNGTGKTTSHTYSAAGTATVTLTVTDNDGASTSVTHQVTTTPANQPPTAAFSSTVNGLVATFDGTGSTDQDGSIVSFAWDFGDNGTSASQNPNHTYASSGTYTVTLTVKDNDGATNSVSHTVTATAPAHPVVAADAFARTVSNAWGTADTGGAWTRVYGAASQHAVANGTGQMTGTSTGQTVGEYLKSVSESDLSGSVDVSLSAVPAGGGDYFTVALRNTTAGEYRLKVRLAPGVTTIVLSRVASSTETTLATSNVSGLTYAAGDVFRIKWDISGTGTTTFTGKVWRASGSEPAAWQVTATDTTAALQVAGALGLTGYVSGVSGTNVPVTFAIGNLSVKRD